MHRLYNKTYIVITIAMLYICLMSLVLRLQILLRLSMLLGRPLFFGLGIIPPLVESCCFCWGYIVPSCLWHIFWFVYGPPYIARVSTLYFPCVATTSIAVLFAWYIRTWNYLSSVYKFQFTTECRCEQYNNYHVRVT